ncbi:ribonuclease H-like domain-containing protein [Mycena crocata]|nr:ribonuclease H-like domain-containing protein [Mycena crocata]
MRFTTLSGFRPFVGLIWSRTVVPGFELARSVSPKMLQRKRAQARLGLSPPLGDRQVLVAVSPVTSDAALPFQNLPPPPSPCCSPAPTADGSDLDLSLGLEQIIPEQAVAILEEFLADDRFTGATWYTDGSLLSGLAGGAAVLVVNGKLLERILLPLGDGQVAEGEIEGLLRATERAIASGAIHILIISDSQAGLKAVLSTAPRAGQFRAILYDKLLRAAMKMSPGLRITNLWTPAHIGTMGNELADDAAKAATLLPAPPSVPVSLTSCKRQINTAILGRWKDLWKVATPGRGLREIDNSPPSLDPHPSVSVPVLCNPSRRLNSGAAPHKFLGT